MAPSKKKRVAIVSIVLCAASLMVFRGNIVATNCSILAVALFAGALLSRQIGSPASSLVTMLIVAAIVDLVSTHAGPTRWIANQAQHPHGPTLLQFLAISFRWKRQPISVMGVSDLMFFTACGCALRRFGRPEAAVLAVPLLGLLSALAVDLFAGLTPALPFLAAAVVVYSYVPFHGGASDRAHHHVDCPG